jgi:hypothetical protein
MQRRFDEIDLGGSARIGRVDDLPARVRVPAAIEIRPALILATFVREQAEEGVVLRLGRLL